MASVKLLDPQDPKNRLDRYELIGEIASGGMAVVYLARIAGLGGFQRFVAIKKLHPHLATEQEFVEMFLDEARLAAGIHNPHVVPILEVGGSSEAGYHLVMEYIEGDTLARVASRAAGRVTGLQPAATATTERPKRAPASMPTGGPAVPRPVTVRILLDSLAGLHAAHDLTDPHGRPLQIVHRDISPQNILVGVDGSARIADFGVARAAARLSTTRSDTVKGKLAYLSPEQARGELVDRRTDLFAMGIILWEMLTGRRLFRGETDHETLARVLGGTIPPPSSLVPGMHPAFDAVTLKALARDTDRRFSTCAEMGDALERAAHEAATAGADGGAAQARDVAAFMNTVLGQEIAAQRESVRVWLSQRNDPSLGASRPPPVVRPTTTGTVQSIVPPMPAPKRPEGLPSSSAPPPRMDAFAPVVNAPHPDDGDPTTLRMMSSLTNASMAVRSKGASEPPFSRKPKTGRIAVVIGAAALLAIGVVVLLKSGDGHTTAPASPVPSETGSALPALSASATSAPSTSATATEAPTTATETPAASAEPTEGPSEGGPKSKTKWHAPTSSKGTSAPTTTSAPVATPTTPATTPPAKPPGDDLSNPYK